MNRALPRPFLNASPQDRFQSVLLSSVNGLTDQINTLSLIGPALVSGPQITVSARFHHVSGAAAIKSIVAPQGFSGGEVLLIPDGAWTTVTGGNIAASFSATVNIPVHAIFDGSLWYLK